MSARAVQLCRGVACFQGLYYLVTGLWPIISIQSFEAATAEKTDDWLVQFFGGLVIVLGVVLLDAWRRGPIRREATVMAVTACIVFIAGDVFFVSRGDIGPIYLADGAVHIVALAGWLAGLFIAKR